MTLTRISALAAALAAAAAGAALGVGASGDDAIRACRHPAGGWLRIPATGKSCKHREQAISWNVRGPQGEPGPPGPAGPPGEAGGDLASLDDLAGIACTARGGGNGTVELEVAGDGTVLLRCTGSGEPPPPGAAKLVINEVDYDQVGADADGFVEIENVGDAAADLTGVALVFVDGGGSVEYRRSNLTGTLEPGGFLVVASDAQNGAPDGLALVDTASNTLLDALSYEGEITSAQIGTGTFSLVEGSALPASVADSNAVDGSLIRNPDGADTDDAASDWAFTTTLTRGATNVLTAP